MADRNLLVGFEAELAKAKAYCEKAMGQVDDEGLHARINPRQNSIAVIVQHLHGNMVSRFTDFLTSDGEKPSRDRDAEFVERNLSRGEIMELWEAGWRATFAAIGSLTDADLARTVTIRKEPYTVCAALLRHVGHCHWHAGQIALIAKHIAGDKWDYLTVPPGGSAAFNRKMGM